MPLTSVTMTLDLPPGCAAYDYYGNAVDSPRRELKLPLDERGIFLRGNPKQSGSFAALLNALRQSKITGLEPLETIAYDMTAPVETKPVVKLRLTNQHNHPIRGKLTVRLGELDIEYPNQIAFQPREQKWIDVKVTGGSAVATNTYPLELEFDAGKDGIARHEESMRVNFIARRTIHVDGKLDDWKGTLPQPIRVAGAGGPSFEQAMLFPFQDFNSQQSAGPGRRLRGP